MRFLRFAAIRLAFAALFFSALGAIVFGYPMVAESTATPCSATAVRLFYLNGNPGGAFGLMAAKFAGGTILENNIRTKHPNESPTADCVGIYWDSLWEPEAYRHANLSGV